MKEQVEGGNFASHQLDAGIFVSIAFIVILCLVGFILGVAVQEHCKVVTTPFSVPTIAKGQAITMRDVIILESDGVRIKAKLLTIDGEGDMHMKEARLWEPTQTPTGKQ